MTFEDELFKKLEAALARSPDGRRFEPLPWADKQAEDWLALPWYARRPSGSLQRLIWLAALCLVGGWLSHTKLLAAFGAGSLAAVIVAQRNSWRQSGSYEVSFATKFLRVHEREMVKIPIVLRNTSAVPTETLLVHSYFNGSVADTTVVAVPGLRPRERRTVVVEYKADRGMGTFHLPAVAVIVRDPLGMFPRCLSYAADITVEVVPAETTMEPLQVNVAGLTMHSGLFAGRSSGDSPTFLGLRPFRSGDSIRRIDWKRSHRQRELVVREFERLNATDATLVLDQRSVACFEFGELNSYELIRDTAIAVAANLIAQQIRVQLVTPSLHIPADKGARHFELLVDVIKDLVPADLGDYATVLRNKADLVPPDSLLVPIFASACIDYAALVEVILALSDRRVETVPVIIDAESFEQQIVAEAHLSSSQRAEIWAMKQGAFGASQPVARLLARLAERTILIGPRQTIASVYRKEPQWRPRHGNV